ncbi:MAG: hypothetical protein RLZZ271_1224 [Pseudomonadota bacterium]
MTTPLLFRSSLLCLTTIAALAVSGCATGTRSPSAKPVLYPNAKFNQTGEAKARAEAEACQARAKQAGLTPDDKNNSVATGVAAAVGTLIGGQNMDRAVRNGAGAAAVGASAGAVNGAFNDRANPTYRHFVERCLSEKGFEVIGWN